MLYKYGGLSFQIKGLGQILKKKSPLCKIKLIWIEIKSLLFCRGDWQAQLAVLSRMTILEVVVVLSTLNSKVHVFSVVSNSL